MNGPRRGAAIFATAALLAGACTGDGGGDDEGGAPAGSGFDAGDCWWDYPLDTTPDEVTISCGTVEVPSAPGDESSDPVKLSVARFHDKGAPEDAPPVLFLHGGPGGAALKSGPDGVLAMPALKERDVIIWDQRGTGDSIPNLNCPEKEQALVDALARPDPWAVELAANQHAVQECRKRLTGDGIDLDHYDTLTSVADMEAIRDALGVERWHLWGESYGTRLALAYAREHTDRVRSLVLDSVYPPEVGGVERAQSLVSSALQRLFDACAADAPCAASYGDLGHLLDTAVADLDRRPEQLTRSVVIGDESKDLPFTITGADVRAGVFVALYRSDLIPALPSIIAALAHGNRSIIPAFIDTGVPNLLEPSEGDFLSVECADSGRLVEGADGQAGLQEVTDDALVALASAQVFCQDWDVEHAPESFNQQVVVDVPTLVFAGTLDPITPYTDSKGQAEAMPDARYVEVPRGGHTVSEFDDCTKQARTSFWADPSADLPACVADLAPKPFTVS
ncbi:MAG: alpha/beta fold hydrolase [Acidimicrobiales bacterium]